MAIHFGDTAPPAGAPGDMWWTGGKLALAIDDLTSLQWVQISAVSDTTIAGPWDFPDAPANGAQFIPSGGSATLTWDGQMWTYPMAAGSSGITVADAPPTGAPPNGLWWDSDSGNLFLNYNDADSTQWVQININAPPTTGIAEAPLDGQQYTRGSSAWSVVASSTGGLTQADADLRYLQLTGGTVTGNLTVNGANAVFNAMNIKFAHASGMQQIWYCGSDLTFPQWQNYWAGDRWTIGGPGADVMRMFLPTKVVEFTAQPVVNGVPIVMGTEMTSMEERLIARICLLEERLAKMEAR